MSISVGSVAVDVVPDVRGFAEQLRAKLSAVKVTIPVDADTTRLRAQLDEATHARTATINVNADTAAASAQIDAVARDRRASVEVSGLGAALSGFSGLGASLAAIGPAVIPITAAVAGLGAALVAPVAAAAGGLTVGGVLAGFAIKDTEKQKKQIDELAKRVQTAKNALAVATTPAGRKSAAAQLAQDTQAYRAALASLTPVQRKFLDAQDRLKSSFKGLVTSSGGALFGPVVKGMDALAKILPNLRPLIVGVSRGVGTLLDDLTRAASGPGFKAFLRSFGRESGAAIVAFGRIFGNFGKGLFNLFRAFGPASRPFVKGIGDTARAFADWSKNLGASKSFQGFLAYLRDVGPKVADTVGHIFGALGKVAVVLAPLGTVSLALVDALAKMVANVKPGVLAAIAGALGAIGLAVLGLEAPTLVVAGMFIAVGGALAYAYKHSEPVRRVFDSIASAFTDHLLPALKDAAHKVWPALLSAVDSVKQSISDNQGLFMVLRDVFKGLGRALVNVVIPALADLYRVYLPALGKAIGVGITSVRIMANAWILMGIAGLESLKLLFVAAISTFDGILTAADKGLGWLPGIGDDIHKARKAFDSFRDNTVAALDAAIGKARDLQAELNFKPKTIRVHFAIDKPPVKSIQGVPIFQSFGAEGAGATGAIINRPTVLLAGESGPEILKPIDQTPGNAPLSGGTPGPMFHVDKVVAQDVNDFLRQMQTRSRLAGLDGVRR